jgi:hypothetical protein
MPVEKGLRPEGGPPRNCRFSSQSDGIDPKPESRWSEPESVPIRPPEDAEPNGQMTTHEKRESLLAAVLLLSATVGLLLLHGTARWIFGVLVAILWLRFIGRRLLQARRRWIALERAGFPPEYEAPETSVGLGGISRKRLALTGLEVTGITLFAIYAMAVMFARIIRDGVTASHILGLVVLAFAVYVFGRLALISWQTAIGNSPDIGDVARRRARRAFRL